MFSDFQNMDLSSIDHLKRMTHVCGFIFHAEFDCGIKTKVFALIGSFAKF